MRRTYSVMTDKILLLQGHVAVQYLARYRRRSGTTVLAVLDDEAYGHFRVFHRREGDEQSVVALALLQLRGIVGLALANPHHLGRAGLAGNGVLEAGSNDLCRAPRAVDHILHGIDHMVPVAAVTFD